MFCNSPPSKTKTFRGYPIPEGYRVMGAKEAAEATGIEIRTLYRALASGRVWAWRIFDGTSPWYVVVAPDGLPADPPRETAPACFRCPRSPEVEREPAP
ncbi:hypothetical protein ACN28S_23925 [Cystobacter fuscus]